MVADHGRRLRHRRRPGRDEAARRDGRLEARGASPRLPSGAHGRRRRAHRPARRGGAGGRRGGVRAGAGGRARHPVPRRSGDGRRARLQPPAAARAWRCATCSPSASACRSPSTTTATRRCSPSGGCGEARGASNAIMLTLGTGIGGGLLVDGRLVHGAPRRGGRARPHHRRRRRAAVSGQLPEPRLPGGARVGPRASAPRGCGSRARSPTARSGGRWTRGARSPARSSPSWPTTATRRRADVMRMMGERLGLGVVSLVNIFNPEVVVVGGGAIAAGELLLAPAREVVAARALPDQSRGRAARVGPLRRRVGNARRGVHGPRRGRGGGRATVDARPGSEPPGGGTRWA